MTSSKCYLHAPKSPATCYHVMLPLPLNCARCYGSIMFTHWSQPLMQIITAIITLVIPAFGARLFGRDKREMLQYAVEICNALPSDMTGTRADWQYYIDRQSRMMIASRVRRRKDKIIGWSWTAIGLFTVFVALFGARSWFFSIDPAAESFVRLFLFGGGMYINIFGMIRIISMPSETAPSPDRSIAILKLLKRESTILNLEGNEMLLSAWTDKLTVTVEAMFGGADRITHELQKTKKEYRKNKKRGRPLDTKKNIAKNLELLEAALVRAQWEQADVMRTIRE